MGGHSHWATTKHHKQAQDAKRGKIFTKLIREITTAARIGGGDASGNPRLRLAISKARESNMPQDNVKRAVQKGTGELPGTTYEDGIYEGYGPGGVALLIEVQTDNKGRTVAEIKNLLTKHGGSMGEAGCVAWMFAKQGLITVARNAVEEDRLMSLVLEAGAEDMRVDEGLFEVIIPPKDFEQVKKALETEKIPLSLAEITMVPKSYVKLEGRQADQMLRLVEALEEHDDVQRVSANFDIPDEVMEKVAAAKG